LSPKVNTHNNLQPRIGRKDNIIDQATTELRLSIEMIKKKRLSCIVPTTQNNSHFCRHFIAAIDTVGKEAFVADDHW
jgi:hypothetical protein